VNNIFYVKVTLPNGKTIKQQLYDDEIFTDCGGCGKEMQVDIEELADSILNYGGDLIGSTWYCSKECLHRARSNLRVINGGGLSNENQNGRGAHGVSAPAHDGR
jgi:hypothetical protein